jgi:transposase InsO family protein
VGCATNRPRDRTPRYRGVTVTVERAPHPVRHGLLAAQQQNRKRKYRRWQRDAPMQLWQLDIMGGVFLADGRECKLVTGIDDHSRFVVIATVVTEPSARAVREAFSAAMTRHGVPSEVLTDNGNNSLADSPSLTPPRCCLSGSVGRTGSPPG